MGQCEALGIGQASVLGLVPHLLSLCLSAPHSFEHSFSAINWLASTPTTPTPSLSGDCPDSMPPCWQPLRFTISA